MQPLFTRFAPYALGFTGGLCVVIFALISSQLIERDLGSSLIVRSAVLVTIIGGLSLGNILGERLAIRVNPRHAVGPLLALGSFAMLFSLLANTGVGQILASPDHMHKRWHALAVATFGFLIPTAILGMIGPVVARMPVGQASDPNSARRSVYLSSSTGLIAGAFISSIALSYSEPSSITVRLAAAALALLGASHSGVGARPVRVLGLLTALCLVLGSSSAREQHLDIGLVDLASYQVKYTDLAVNVLAFAMAIAGLAGLAGELRRHNKARAALTNTEPAVEKADEGHLCSSPSTPSRLSGSHFADFPRGKITGFIINPMQAIWLIIFATMATLTILARRTSAPVVL